MERIEFLGEGLVMQGGRSHVISEPFRILWPLDVLRALQSSIDLNRTARFKLTDAPPWDRDRMMMVQITSMEEEARTRVVTFTGTYHSHQGDHAVWGWCNWETREGILWYNASPNAVPTPVRATAAQP